MSKESIRKEALHSLKTQEPKLCVLATSSKNGNPQCAVVGYGVRDDLSIVVCTSIVSRKCVNIKENEKVALAVGWNFNRPALQFEGTARIIRQGKEYRETEEFFYSVNNYKRKFKNEDTVFISIKPTWVRIIYLSQSPVAVEEERI